MKTMTHYSDYSDPIFGSLNGILSYKAVSYGALTVLSIKHWKQLKITKNLSGLFQGCGADEIPSTTVSEFSIWGFISYFQLEFVSSG